MASFFCVPVDELTAAIFEEGLGFDGSSIRGWQSIHTSDMLVVPDAETAVMDPFTKYATLSLICNIVDPITKERYTRDPRHIAQKAESYLKPTGLGDTCYMGPEAEFFIFDDIRFDQNSHSGYYYIDSVEGIWNSGREESPNLGYKPRHKEGYFPVPPIDSQEDIRTEMVEEMQKVGIYIERQHHEVATAGQAEIDMRFNSLVKIADQLMYSTSSRTWQSATTRPSPSCPSRSSATTDRACTLISPSGRATRQQRRVRRGFLPNLPAAYIGSSTFLSAT